MIVKVGLLGITAVFLALILQKEKAEFAMLLADDCFVFIGYA